MIYKTKLNGDTRIIYKFVLFPRHITNTNNKIWLEKAFFKQTYDGYHWITNEVLQKLDETDKNLYLKQ